MNIGRFQYTPPWKLTRWGFVWSGFRGSDEYHNLSYFVCVPLVGMFVWFLSANRETHCDAGFTAPDGLHLFGTPVPGCPICDDLMEDWIGWEPGQPIIIEPNLRNED